MNLAVLLADVSAVGLVVVCVAAGVLAAVAVCVVVLRRAETRRTNAALVALGTKLDSGFAGDAEHETDHSTARLLRRLDAAVDRQLEHVEQERLVARRLERALGAIPEGVVVVGEEGQTVYRNEVARDFETARHADALVEAAMRELVHDAVSGGVAGNRTLELFGPPRRTVNISARPLLTDGRAVGALAIIDDITDRRRLEAIRRDFVANISHELRTPVGALSLLADTLIEEDDPAVASRLAGRMVNEATRLANTIEDLLVLSRIESEEAPEREPVPIHLVVAEAAMRIGPAAEQADIDIDVREPDPHLAVMGDRRQLVSAVYNLLDNAVKYSDAGSTVEVSASTDGQHVRLAVADHGIGIPARDLERVFERFYRVDVARSRQTGGTGLGLSIVRHVAGNHAGDVDVESRLGEGSTFVLRLPLTATGPVAVDGSEPLSTPQMERDAG